MIFTLHLTVPQSFPILLLLQLLLEEYNIYSGILYGVTNLHNIYDIVWWNYSWVHINTSRKICIGMGGEYSWSRNTHIGTLLIFFFIWWASSILYNCNIFHKKYYVLLKFINLEKRYAFVVCEVLLMFSFFLCSLLSLFYVMMIIGYKFYYIISF